MKKLYRSSTNKIVGGLLGGVGEYFDIDPVIVRVIFIFLFAVTHIVPMTIVYALGLVVVPLAPLVTTVKEEDLNS